LGSPVCGDPRQMTNVWKLYQRVAGHSVDNPPVTNIIAKPPVPTLAIWSRRDGIVAVHSARGTEESRDREVEVDSGHMAFAVSQGGARQAAREIKRFLAEIKG
jgi:pimeloyl-ACP methyl ester carboxylesterase